MKGRHLLSIADLTADELWRLLRRSLELKKESRPLLAGRTLALLFEKPSLRTRVSFDVAMHQLGGHALYLSPAEVGLGKREPVADVARVLSRYVDAIVVRTFPHSTTELLARHATVPVINGLDDEEHPCQALADLLTIYEKKGRLQGLTVAFIGDSNNVATSLLLAATLTGASFRIASPHGYWIKDQYLTRARSFAAASGSHILLTDDPRTAVEGADVIYTDVWTSMGQEAEEKVRRQVFAHYQVTPELLAAARPGAILMHPLPAHPGEELAPGLIDSPSSVVFDQAENRLHVQKAVLVELLA